MKNEVTAVHPRCLAPSALPRMQQGLEELLRSGRTGRNPSSAPNSSGTLLAQRHERGGWSHPPAGSLQGSGEVMQLLPAQGPQLQRSGTQAAQAPSCVSGGLGAGAQLVHSAILDTWGAPVKLEQ